jgi:hypothetical protein
LQGRVRSRRISIRGEALGIDAVGQSATEKPPQKQGPERRNPWVDRNRRRIQGKNHHKPAKMVRMKKTHIKRNTQMEENPISHRRISRMEQAARDAKGTFQALVEPKGKATITRWEKEITAKRKGKAWEELSQEADWITDPGTTQSRETLYHKTVEMAWQTKMLIGKVSTEKKAASRKGNKAKKKIAKRNPESPQQPGR